MRIYLAIEGSHYGIPCSDVWFKHFYPSVVEMGHEVIVLGINTGQNNITKGVIS